MTYDKPSVVRHPATSQKENHFWFSFLFYGGLFSKETDFYEITQDGNDLYFNIETGNIYIPCHNGFQKYNIDVEKELINFFKSHQIQQEEDCQTHLELYSFEPLQQEKDESEIDL